jgi:hypothetical protein
MRWAGTVSLESRRSLANILVMNDLQAALRPCSEGSVVNLDTLPAAIIEQMYNLLVYIHERTGAR